MPTANVSPFTFITWKEDENAIVAGTGDTKLGYIQLLTIDGINIDDIVAHAMEKNGSNALVEGLATNFPQYVADVAAVKGTPCFVTSGKAAVEYADMNTGEVSEGVFDANEANYTESVRVDTARAAHTAKTSSGGAAGAGAGAGAGGAGGEAGAGEQEDDDDDDYEDVDEDDEAQQPNSKEDAYFGKRRLLDMVSTQLQTAMSIAFDLGFTVEETREAYRHAVPPLYPIPQTPEECFTIAKDDPALREFLGHTIPSGAGGEGGEDGAGDAAAGAGRPSQGRQQEGPQGPECSQQ